MKYYLTTIAIVITTLIAACTQNTVSTSYIFGNISGIENGTMVLVKFSATHKDEIPLDTAIVNNGQFELAVNLDGPRALNVYTQNNPYITTIMASQGEKIFISGNKEKLVVTGAQLQTAYNEKFAITREFLNKKYSELGGNDEFFHLCNRVIDSSVMANKDSWWGPFLLLEHTSYFTDEFVETYNSFSDEAKNSFYGELVKQELFPSTLEKAPNFKAADIDGKEYSLSQLCDGNKYLIIDFWASWCVPCRKAIPEIKRLASKYADKGLSVVSISIDSDYQAWLKALKQEQMPWVNLYDSSKINEAYGVKTIPSIFIVECSTGKVLGEKLYGKLVEIKLTEIFGE